MTERKKLKIAVVIDVFDETSGGGAIAAQRFVKFLRHYHDVTVISTGKPAAGKVVLPGFRIPFARRVMREMRFSFARPIKETLEKTFAEMDIVHVQFPFLLGIKAVKIANRIPVPVVASFLVQPENIFYNIGVRSKFLIDHTYRFFVRNFFNHSHAVIFPTEFAERELKRYGLKSPGHVISNGILPEFRPMSPRRDPEYRGRFVILSVGRLAKDKRLDVLIRAISLSEHKNAIQLVVVGMGPEKEELIRLGQTLPHPPVFRFSFINQEELIRQYNTADLFVHPSEVELEGLAVLEAMACGLPPLISDSRTNASRQFCLDDRFLFSNGDAGSLVSKIDYWINHREELNEARKKYLELAQRYHIQESVRELEKIYFDLHQNNRGG